MKPKTIILTSDCWRSYFILALIALLPIGCATLPENYPRSTSTAFEDYHNTTVGQLFDEMAVKHPGKSGFGLIRYGRQAFTARIAMTELAEKSLDVQYYIWESDSTGWILAERLIRAADRGVRVRILVDDINLTGRDPGVAAMDAHPNIEIRVFNPFAQRDGRLWELVMDLDRVNHRMHNKAMIMDNALAIIGGRNIGNHYFDVATDANFRDLDIAAAGPVVREISTVFDHFWNGDWSKPIAALAKKPYTEADLLEGQKALAQMIKERDYPYPLDQDIAALTSEFTSIRDQFIWAPGWIVWDDPAAIKEGILEGNVVRGLLKKVPTLQDEVLLESAYLVFRDLSFDILNELAQRGVKVRILTNSLASNDVVAAHAGYAKRREEIITSGVELYEYRPDAGVHKSRAYQSETKAALHTKAMVFDRDSVFIGSFNLDPRSASINTEAGLYVESPELAEQVIAYMDEGIQPENSYRVLLDEDGNLVWITEIDGQEVRYHKDPKTGFWRRFTADVLMTLPIDHQL